MKKEEVDDKTAFTLNLNWIADFYIGALGQAMRQSGIKTDHLRVLMSVLEGPRDGVSCAALQQDLNLAPYQIKRIIDWLKRRRLVSVSVNPVDRRSRVLRPLKSGRRLADGLAQAVVAYLKGHFDPMFEKPISFVKVSTLLSDLRSEIIKCSSFRRKPSLLDRWPTSRRTTASQHTAPPATPRDPRPPLANKKTRAGWPTLEAPLFENK